MNVRGRSLYRLQRDHLDCMNGGKLRYVLSQYSPCPGTPGCRAYVICVQHPRSGDVRPPCGERGIRPRYELVEPSSRGEDELRLPSGQCGDLRRKLKVVGRGGCRAERAVRLKADGKHSLGPRELFGKRCHRLKVDVDRLEVDHGNPELRAQHGNESVPRDETVHDKSLDQAGAGLFPGVPGCLKLFESNESGFDEVLANSVVERWRGT